MDKKPGEVNKILTGLLLMAVCILLSGCRWLEKPGYEPDAISNVEEIAVDKDSCELSDRTAGGTSDTAGSTSDAAGDITDAAADDSTAGTAAGSSAAGTAGTNSIGSTSNVQEDFSFPPYTYPGTDPLYRAICAYIVGDFTAGSGSAGSGQGDSCVCVPCPLIVDIDESNAEDIRILGEFWCHRYTKEGDVLKAVSFESIPGMMHLRESASTGDPENGAAYEVTGMDVAAEDSAEEIFGESYQAYVALDSFISIREIFRTQMLEDYLLLNHIPAVKYQDSEYKSVDLIPKTASIASAEALALHDADGSGQTYTFTYEDQTFMAQYQEDNWKIIDSWKIQNAGDMEMICAALQEIHSVHSRDGEDTRTAEDMAFEWMQHNFAYEHLPEDHPWRENAKDVDLNPADQGKTFFEIYEDRAQDRFRIGDFLGDMTAYIQILQEMDLDQPGVNSE